MSANNAVAFADGMLDARERPKWQLHLAECGICRQMVAALVNTGRPEEGQAPSVQVGDKVGRFTLIEELGAGGFGVVYRAEDPDLDRAVAVKLWKLRSSDPASVEEGRLRLLGEARALAKLTHPNVMAVYEAGEAEDGRVFLAGELIEGRSLAEVIEEEGLAPARARTLVLQAAEGLAAAHDVGLVHRDVKPENILVGDSGRVCLVDFGLARGLTETDIVGRSAEAIVLRETLTLTGSLVGTPAYMAPEQLEGKPADAASDQFALCITLFEAIAGHRPFAGETFAELRAHVLADERRELPPGASGAVRRVLDRGLSHNPEDRYPSIHELVADLQRDPGRRWRQAALATTLVAAGAGAAMLAWPSSTAGPDCESARGQMARVWNVTQKDQLRSVFSSSAQGKLGTEAFELTSARLDDYAGEWVAMSIDSCAATHQRGQQSEKLLDTRDLCLQRRLHEMQALVGLFADADEALVERAPRAITQLVPLEYCANVDALSQLDSLPGDPETRAAVREQEAALAEVEALRMAGKYEAAMSSAVVLAKKVESLGYAPLTAEAHFEVGYLHSYQNQPAEADSWLQNAHHEALAARAFHVAARAAVELVMVYGDMQGDASRAKDWARHAQSAIAAAGGDGFLQSNLDSNLGLTAQAAGDMDEAHKMHSIALETRRRVFGARDRAVAQSLNSLGLVEQSRGHYFEAATHFGEAHAIFAEALGPHHPYVGLTASNVGTLELQVGKIQAAEEHFRQALSIARDSRGSKSIDALNAYFNLATALDEMGKGPEALAILDELLSDYQKLFPNDKEAIARVYNSLGVVASKGPSLEAAKTHFESAATLRAEISGAEHPDTLFVKLNLAITEGRLGNYETALKLLEPIGVGFAKSLGEEHPFLARTLLAQGEQYVNLDRGAEGIEKLERALALFEGQASDPEARADARYHLGRARWQSGDKDGIAEVEAALLAYQELGERGEEGAAEAKAWLADR